MPYLASQVGQSARVLYTDHMDPVLFPNLAHFFPIIDCDDWSEVRQDVIEKNFFFHHRVPSLITCMTHQQVIDG